MLVTRRFGHASTRVPTVKISGKLKFGRDKSGENLGELGLDWQSAYFCLIFSLSSFALPLVLLLMGRFFCSGRAASFQEVLNQNQVYFFALDISTDTLVPLTGIFFLSGSLLVAYAAADGYDRYGINFVIFSSSRTLFA